LGHFRPSWGSKTPSAFCPVSNTFFVQGHQSPAQNFRKISKVAITDGGDELEQRPLSQKFLGAHLYRIAYGAILHNLPRHFVRGAGQTEQAPVIAE